MSNMFFDKFFPIKPNIHIILLTQLTDRLVRRRDLQVRKTLFIIGFYAGLTKKIFLICN